MNEWIQNYALWTYIFSIRIYIYIEFYVTSVWFSIQHRIQWQGRGTKKHEIYVAAFGSHLFYDLFVQGWGAMAPLVPPGSATGISQAYTYMEVAIVKEKETKENKQQAVTMELSTPGGSVALSALHQHLTDVN